jgi:hypothetical protein
LQQLKGPRRVRVVAFVVVGIAGFGPWMGLNGALIRYTLPFASVLLAHRLLARDPGASAPRRGLIAFLLAAVLLAANALTSPEIGAAFVFGWGAYCALRLFQKDWPIAAGSLIAIVATGGVAPFVLPAAYYTSLLRFSQGANNLPLLPAAHPLLFLVTLLMVVPPLLLAGWRGRAADAPLSGAMGVLCLGMMPGALGRGDPPHVLYYGLVASAILIVQLGTVSGPGHRLYTAAYGFVFIGLTWVVTGTVFLGLQPRQLISNPPRAIRNVVEYVLGQCAHADRPRLDALKKYRNVGLPLATYGNDNSAEVYLLEQKRVLPEYFVATVGVYTEAELARKLVQVERAEYILVARGLHEEIKYDLCDQHRWTIRHWLLYPARLECRNLDLDTFGAVNRLIATQYDVVETVGRSVVMRRRASEARTRNFTSSKSPGFQLPSNAALSGP